jgi:hypothetical protein
MRTTTFSKVLLCGSSLVAMIGCGTSDSDDDGSALTTPAAEQTSSPETTGAQQSSESAAADPADSTSTTTPVPSGPPPEWPADVPFPEGHMVSQSTGEPAAVVVDASTTPVTFRFSKGPSFPSPMDVTGGFWVWMDLVGLPCPERQATDAFSCTGSLPGGQTVSVDLDGQGGASVTFP